jgi:hypothetical protein
MIKEEDFTMTREEEVQLIHTLLLHPAGFDIDIAGILWARRYEHPKWAVEWEVSGSTEIEVVEFDNVLEAATYFVNKRHEMKLGLDYDFFNFT